MSVARRRRVSASCPASPSLAGLPIARPLGELDEHCQLPEAVRRKFLRTNAVRAFKLEVSP